MAKKELFDSNVFSSNFNSLESVDTNLIEVDAANTYTAISENELKTISGNITKPEKHESKKEETNPEDDNLIDLDKPNEEIEEEELKIPEKVKTKVETKIEETQKSSLKSNEKASPLNTKNLTLSPYAVLLSEKGILPNLNMEEFNKLKDPEEQINALAEAHHNELENGIERWIDSLPSEIKYIMNNYVDGVPVSKILNVMDKVDNYYAIKEDTLVKDDAMMKKILIEDKMATGYTQEEAESEIDNLVDLEKPAKNALKRLTRNELQKVEAEKHRINQEREYFKKKNDESIKYVSKVINDTSELIPGITMNEKMKRSLSDSMFRPVDFDQQGNPISKVVAVRNQDPIKFELILHHLVDITNGFTDFSKFNKNFKSKALKEFETALEKENVNGGGNPIYENTSPKSKKLLGSLKQMFGEQ